MYVISGASGRIGSAVAGDLLDSGHPVRAVVRRPDAAADWTSRGAEAVVMDLRDGQKLTEALNGAKAFFAMMPFDLSVPDLDQYAAEVVGAVSNAVKDSDVRHTVMLSSGGADLAEGTGPILGLHHMEQALAQTGTTLTALRPGSSWFSPQVRTRPCPWWPPVTSRRSRSRSCWRIHGPVRLWTSWARSTPSVRLPGR